MKEQHETLADEVPNVRVVGVNTPKEMTAYVKELRDKAAAVAADVSWNQRKEKRDERLFIGCGMTAGTSFVLGIALLLLFAVANIGVPPKLPETKSETHPATTANPAQTKSVTVAKDKVVDVPCVGIVTFPASISDDDVSAACKALFDREEEARKKNGMPSCKTP